MPADNQRTFSDIIVRLNELGEHKTRLVVGVDGRGGAGKSSLVRRIAVETPGAVHVEYDWFHLPQSEVTPTIRFDPIRLIHEVIYPFRSGQSELCFCRYNWGYLTDAEDGFDPKPIIINDAKVLIVEGCESLHPLLVPFYDLRIWLDTKADESMRRGITRDIDDYKLDPDKVHKLWSEWAVWEKQNLSLDDRSLRADMIL